MRHHTTIDSTVENKTACISCGSILTGNYCSVCGEKRFELHDLALKHYAEESIEGITHFDNKFFKSVKLLITKPGLLALDFCRGKRVPFMRPFALFFVCNIFYFLLIGQNNLFSTPLTSFYNFYPFTEFHSKEIIDQVAPTNEQFKVVATIFNQKMGIESKAFLVVFIPLLAIGGILVYRRRYLSEHLIFSTYLFAFLLLFYTFIGSCITNPYYYFFVKGNYDSTYDLVSALTAWIIFGVYYFFAARRFYKASVLRSIIGSVVTMLLFLVCLYGYRILLFFKIIHSIGV